MGEMIGEMGVFANSCKSKVSRIFLWVFWWELVLDGWDGSKIDALKMGVLLSSAQVNSNVSINNFVINRFGICSSATADETMKSPGGGGVGHWGREGECLGMVADCSNGTNGGKPVKSGTGVRVFAGPVL